MLHQKGVSPTHGIGDAQLARYFFESQKVGAKYPQFVRVLSPSPPDRHACRLTPSAPRPRGGILRRCAVWIRPGALLVNKLRHRLKQLVRPLRLPFLDSSMQVSICVHRT